ncbi:hypothetical protein BS78_04G190700 [Paspalum vaginatum]|nr:hypothetical protein BS78_04G190700 [Paspalum vaginatum]
MQKRVVLVTAAAAALGVAAVVLGFIAESAKSKSFVGYIRERCVYRRTAALACGIAAALLALAAVALVTAATGCFGRYGGGATGRRRVAVARLSGLAWVLVVVAAALFLYGAAMNRGGTRGLSASRPRVRRYGPYYYYYGCAVLRSGVFASASIIAAAATACAIAAYVYLQKADETAPVVLGQYAAQGGGVAMGQPQWAQPYPQAYPPPVGYPAAAPPYGGGYGATKQQPAGTA